jgi:hypothetical protein
MFAKFAVNASAKSTVKTVDLTLTTAFVRALIAEDIRISYGALTMAARALGEDTSGQKAAQRGSKLVKSLPLEMQPHVCRKSGKYAKGVTWETTVPADLTQRPVITEESVEEALEAWEKAQEDASEE